MPDGGAGADRPAGYSDLADRQTRRRPGPSPSRWPRLIPSRIAPEMLLRDTGPSSAATRIWRIAACKGVRTGCLVSEGDRQNEGIAAFSTDSGGDIHRRCCGRKVGKEEKKKVQRRREFRMVIPGAANGPGVGRRSFCRLLPAYGQEQAVYFVRLAPPQDANHTVCALINHING